MFEMQEHMQEQKSTHPASLPMLFAPCSARAMFSVSAPREAPLCQRCAIQRNGECLARAFKRLLKHGTQHVHSSTMQWTPYVCKDESVMTCRQVSNVATNIENPTKERCERPLSAVNMVT